MPLDYRQRVYERYVSAFKGISAEKPNYSFSDAKLLPLLRPWVGALDRGWPCVDLGCGHGNVLHALRTLGFSNLQGVDASAEQVALAQAILPEIEAGQLEPYLRRFPDGHFGLIAMFDVVEHLRMDELLDLLDLIAAKLRPGGIYVAHCPNGDSPFALQVFSGDLTHVTLLNSASAEVLCRLAGLHDFAASEHLGASAGLAGSVRALAWRLMRAGMRCRTLIETGGAGSSVLTRNFAFRAVKP